MKKILLPGLLSVTLLSPLSAMADPEPTPAVVSPSALTTKSYVDVGLRAVYNVATSAQSTANTAASGVTGLQNVVGDNTTGLVKDVNDLKTTVNDASTGLVKQVSDLTQTVNNLSAGTTYTAGTGINIDTANNNAININGLSATTSGKMYVFKNQALTELETVSSWDPSVLTNQ